MQHDPAYWKAHLGLEPHPEGGFYRQIYRSEEVLDMDSLPDRYPGDRNLATCIYFLLEQDSFSAFHRLESDELWHYHAGDPLTVYLLDPRTKGLSTLHLGPQPDLGHSLTVVIPHDTWFAARVDNDGVYSLVSCTVAPGYTEEDFFLAERDLLQTVFPEHAALIASLTRG